MLFAFVIAPLLVPNWQRQETMEFVTGYIIEMSLSMDNVFVIALIFVYFRVPSQFQHRVLFWGILGALVMRGVMIALGAALVQRFSWTLYLFGAFLLFTGVKMIFVTDESHVRFQFVGVPRLCQPCVLFARLPEPWHSNGFVPAPAKKAKSAASLRNRFSCLNIYGEVVLRCARYVAFQ